MKSMLTKRTLLVALIAGGGVLAASAYATNGGSADSKTGCEARHGQMMKVKWEARHEARMSGLKEKLKLAPAQEAAWQTFAEVGKPGPLAVGADRQAMRESFEKMTAPQRMDAMLEKADLRRAHLVARAAAVKRFYAELTPEQQVVFDAEAMPLFGRGHGDGHHGPMRRQS
jgi:protein CpxP